MGQTFKMAWRNMWRNWRRTVIALVAIVAGLILLLLLDGLIKGSDQAVFGNAVRLYGGNVMVHAPGYSAKASRLPMLPLEDADAVVQAARVQPNVVAAAKRINTAGIASSREGTYAVEITAIEPEVEAPLSIQAKNIVQGRFLQGDDGDAILIGKGLADRLQVAPGDNLVLLGRSKNETMRQHSMTVVGIYDLGAPDIEKRMVYLTLPEAQTLYNLRDQATEVSISLESVGQEDAAVAAFKRVLPAYEIDSWATLRPEIRQAIDAKAGFTGVFGLIVVLIACIGVLNLMMMAVFERTREMGVLAALGMKGRRVMALFLLEGSLIGAVAAVIGCILGVLLLGWLGRVGIDISKFSGVGEVTALMGDRMYPVIRVSDLISRAIAVTLIAALASLYPAWQAARKQPAEALHHV